MCDIISNPGYWKYHFPAGVGSPVSDQAGVVYPVRLIHILGLASKLGLVQRQ